MILQVSKVFLNTVLLQPICGLHQGPALGVIHGICHDLKRHEVDDPDFYWRGGSL